jgi:N-acyl homoserine lactone hydrolase
VFWSDELASASIGKLLAIGDLLYPGHDLPFRLGPRGKTGYLHDLELTLTGVEAGQPGLTLRPDRELRRTIMPGIEEQRMPA